MGRGTWECPPPQPTKGSGADAPQRAPGWRPSRKRVLEYLDLEKNTPDSHESVIFDISAAYT